MIGGMIEQKQLHFFIFIKFNSLMVKILFISFLEPSKVVEIFHKRNGKVDNLVYGILLRVIEKQKVIQLLE